MSHGRSLNILHHNHSMRIAHIHTTDLHRFQTDHHHMRQSIICFVRNRYKRNFRRRKARFAHIHGHQTIIQQLGNNHALSRFHQNFLFIGQTFIRHKSGKTARAVATLLHLAAVRIEYTITEIHRIGRRLFHQQQLIEAHPSKTVGPFGKRRSQRIKILPDTVYHHKIIAQTVHFGKFQSFHQFSCL